MSCINRRSIGIACLGLMITATAQADFDRLAKLLASDGEAYDYFGQSVAIGGSLGNEVAIVGAPHWVDGLYGIDYGSAYLFEVKSGLQIAQLYLANPHSGNRFGESVAIGGGTAIIGANGVDPAGAVYLFDIRTGEQLAELRANDAEPGDGFGNSVAVSGNIIIIANHSDDTKAGQDAGSAYLFNLHTHQQLAKIEADDGAHSDCFGVEVAISGDAAIFGAYRDEDNGDESGSAYVFDISDPTMPVQIAKLLPDDGAPHDLFGWSVAISGSIAIVGAQQDGDNDVHSGSAYLFDTGTGEQIAKILPNDGQAGDLFGYAVSISGPVAMASGGGGVYLFDISDPTRPRQIAKLVPDAHHFWQDSFGIPIAGSPTTILVGASSDDDIGDSAGAAYLFEAACACEDPKCDCNNNGVSDDCDVAHGTSTDCNGNDVPDECEPLEDCNDNGLFDACDIADGTSADCNANGFPDECDIADGTSEDCNGDGVPDECELPDCNDNGAPDECDLADGISADCNANGIPDECEPFEDCNANGVPDDCDIAGGAIDCDDDGVPDECDYVIGDLNGDGIVGTTDLLILLSEWGHCGDCDNCLGDLDCDCSVGTLDLIILLGNWG